MELSWGRTRTLVWMLLLLAGTAAAEPKLADVVLVADSRNLTGVTAWLANLFNQSHGYFALLTVVSIPFSGMIFGIIADFFIGRIGIDLKSRSLREG